MIQLILYFLIGSLAGISMGTVGVGAGVISIPLLTYCGMSINNAVGAGLFMQLLPQSLPGFYLYHKKGYIDYLSSCVVVLGSLVGILCGAYLITNDYISEKMLYKLLTILLIIVSIYYTKKSFYD